MATNWVRWIGQLGIVPTASFTIALLLAGCGGAAFAAQSSSGQHALLVKVNPANGNYSVGVLGANSYALTAEVGAQVDGRWLYASDYPRHTMERSTAPGYLGTAVDWRVTYSGLSGQPDLIYYLRAYSGMPFGDIQVTVRNTTAKTIYVEAIRSLQTIEGKVLDLGGPTTQDRVRGVCSRESAGSGLLLLGGSSVPAQTSKFTAFLLRPKATPVLTSRE